MSRPPPRAVGQARSRAAGGLLPLLGSGCSAAPAQDVLGSFFPSWLLCTAIGIALSVLCRLVLGAAGIHDEVPVPALTYIAAAGAATLLVWLVWFGH